MALALADPSIDLSLPVIAIAAQWTKSPVTPMVSTALVLYVTECIFARSLPLFTLVFPAALSSLARSSLTTPCR